MSSKPATGKPLPGNRRRIKRTLITIGSLLVLVAGSWLYCKIGCGFELFRTYNTGTDARLWSRTSPAGLLKSLLDPPVRAEALLREMTLGGRGRISITFPDRSTLRRTESGTLLFRDSSGRELLKLDDHHDFSRLLRGATAGGRFTSYGNINNSSGIARFLQDNVSAYYGRFDGGNFRTANLRGSGRFRYRRIRQLLATASAPHTTDATSQARGFECFFSSMVHVYKSAGLIVPDYTREEIENRYTHLFNDAGMGQYRRAPTDRGYGIPPHHVNLMRGKANSTKGSFFADFLEIARGLQQTGWAKLTGMGTVPLRFAANTGLAEAKKLIAQGYVAQVGLIHNLLWHYVAPVDVQESGRATVITVDDSWFIKKNLVYAQGEYTDFRFILTGGAPGAVGTGNVRPADNVSLPALRVTRDYVPFIKVYWLPRDCDVLNFNSHLITDVTSLALVDTLESLDLSNNPLRDIRPLARLYRLRHLNLRRTLVSDLAPLAGLTNLQTLNISHTPVTGLRTLPPNLKRLLLDPAALKMAGAHYRKRNPACPILFTADNYVDATPVRGPLDLRWTGNTRLARLP